MCAAFDTVSKAVQLQTHADLGPDPIAQTAVASNARLSLIGGGEYLLSRLDDQTPPELAEAVRSFANNLDDIGMNALAGATNEDPQQAARLTAGEAGRNKIARALQVARDSLRAIVRLSRKCNIDGMSDTHVVTNQVPPLEDYNPARRRCSPRR